MAIKGNSEKFRKLLWPKIGESSSAMDAMKLAQWVGLMIAIGYGMALVLAFSTDRYPDGTPFEDEAELYGIGFIYFVLILLGLLFWLLARWGKGWAVLFVCTWGLLEAVVKLLILPGQGVIVAVLTVLFCVSGFRGWAGVRKYGRPGDGRADNTQETLSVQIANQIINIANDRHKDGSPVDEIAAGLRHAAANFSAFAYFRSENKGLYSNAIADEFVNLLTQYLERHRPTEQPAQGLYQLIEQAKNEI